MGWSWFFKSLLVSVILLLFFSQGFGRKMMESVESWEQGNTQSEENIAGGVSREMIEVMDYPDPHPNNNPKQGYIFGPPPQG